MSGNRPKNIPVDQIVHLRKLRMVFIVPGETLKFNQGETEPVFLEITDKYWECH